MVEIFVETFHGVPRKFWPITERSLRILVPDLGRFLICKSKVFKGLQTSSMNRYAWEISKLVLTRIVKCVTNPEIFRGREACEICQTSGI
jgi:hypothetical protein